MNSHVLPDDPSSSCATNYPVGITTIHGSLSNMCIGYVATNTPSSLYYMLRFVYLIDLHGFMYHSDHKVDQTQPKN